MSGAYEIVGKKPSAKGLDDVDRAVAELLRTGRIEAFWVPDDDVHFVVPEAVESFLDDYPDAVGMPEEVWVAVCKRVKEMEAQHE